VQMTIDKKIICFHDFRLGRTALGRKPIGRLPYKYLRKLDVGSWFDKFFHAQRIPTLGKVIELLRDKAYLNIEIKTSRKENNKERIRRTLDIIKEKEFLPFTLFGSTDYKMLAYLKELEPQAHTSAIHHPNNKLTPRELKEQFGIEAFVCSTNEITSELDSNCRESGVHLGLYSIDNWYELEKIKQFHPKTIVSNYPGSVQPIIHRYFS